MKLKKCKACKEKYQPSRPLQQVCSAKCALEYLKQVDKRKREKETRQWKRDIMTRQEWLKALQVIFNKYIRERDKDLPCISCQRHHKGQYHAGHYRSVGSCPELRFHELNVHKQCSTCNNYLSGNLIEYRKNLIQKIGVDMVDFIEGPHKPKKYTLEEIKSLILLYKDKIKSLS